MLATRTTICMYAANFYYQKAYLFCHKNVWNGQKHFGMLDLWACFLVVDENLKSFFYFSSCGKYKNEE